MSDGTCGFGNLPTNSETVKQMVMNEGRDVRTFVTTELARKKSEGQRFSLTLSITAKSQIHERKCS